MPALEIHGQHFEVTELGFLVNRDDWTEEIGHALAVNSGVELGARHWEIVHFIRDYYQRFNHIPNNRVFVKAVEKQLGKDKGNSRYLYGLFPEGPLKFACMIAGLPKPSSCI